MDRKNCTHECHWVEVVTVRWCARCSGWQVKRVGVPSGSSSDTVSLQVSESHFLPSEDAGPEDAGAVMRRAMIVTRDAEIDHLSPRLWS